MLALSSNAAANALVALTACPDCITAREARASVFGDHFAERLATLLVPLIAMTLLAMLFSWLERGTVKL